MTTLTIGKMVLEWDETLKVGDLITAYHKGFHRITAIKSRRNDPPLIEYSREYDIKGKRASAVKDSCDGSYCRKAALALSKGIVEKDDEIKRYNEILRIC